MRKRLMAAAALAPLSMIGFQAAHASTTISSDSSTPVTTAAGGDVTQAASTTFTITGTTPAFTVNSNNALVLNGTVTSKDINSATAILIQGPFTGTVTNVGAINLTESYTATDSVNSDGVVEAPFAQGSNRVGIQQTGAFTGNITNSGSITLQGNTSTGIALGATLNGSLEDTGTISLLGDNGYAIRTTGEITGEMRVTGAITVKGQNTVGVRTDGPIDGSLRIYTTISSTGYAVTARQTGALLTKIQATPADVQQGGSALQILGSVGGGVFLGAPPSTTVSTDTTTDADADGVVDSSEGAASLVTYGSAPALQIGGPAAINLGNFGTGSNAYGLIIEGSVSGQGLNDGVSATAIDLGVGGNGVNLNGGIRVSGTVNAASYQADALGIHLQKGVTGTSLLNDGSITAGVISGSASTATALLIDSGATLTSIVNVGTLAAGVTGDTANALVVVDKSGSLNTVSNYGAITATLTPAVTGEAVSGQGVALDLRANTTGVTYLQTQASGSTTVPSLVGDVLLGSGPNTVSLLSGTMKGALSMGSAPGSLTIDNAASYIGALTYSGTQLAINLTNGTLQDNSATTVGASSLTVGAASTLTVTLDPANNRSTLFNVSGAASFATGSKIGATLASTPALTSQTFTIVKAGTLSASGLDTTLIASLPYIVTGSASVNAAANSITLTVRTKSTTELGLNKSEKAAFGAILADLPQDSGVQTAVITASTRSALISAYDQLLPNSSGDVFQTAFGISRSISRAAADRFDITTRHDDEDEDDFITSGFWASEFYSGMEQNKIDNNAYHSAAVGVVGGYDFGGTGITIAGGSANITRPHQVGDSLNSVSTVEAGLYANPRFGALTIDARVGGAYLKMSNRRQLVASVVSGDLSTTSTVTRTAEGSWNGYDLTAHLGAALQLDLTKHLFIQPRVYADVLHMHEDAYAERNGGTAFDFVVSQRNSTQTNGAATVVTGLRFGNLFVVSPQLEVGYDKVVTGGPGSTTARFAYGGSSFSVPANQIGGAAVGRLTLRGDGNYVHFALQAGGEYASGYHSMDMKAVFRLTF